MGVRFPLHAPLSQPPNKGDIAMRNQHGFTIGEALIVLIWIAGIVGWAMNIIKLISNAAFDFEGIMRMIGIFVAPLGALFGLFWW